MNAACKSNLISIDGRFRMNVSPTYHTITLPSLPLSQDAVVTANVANMFSRGSHDHSPNALVLTVRRSHLLQDTVTVLPHHSSSDYKKPLHVRCVMVGG